MDKKPVSVNEIFKAITEVNGEVIYKLRDQTITGKLDLTYHSIKKTIVIQDCVFIDEVDLSYCEFKQPVCLTGTRFEQSFTSEGTVFRGKFECDNAIFKGEASFEGIK